MWQDYVIMGVQVVFAISLLPTILHSTQKPTMATCVISAGCVITLAFVFASLGLWFAVATSCLNMTLWVVLAFQRHRLNKLEKNASSRSSANALL